MGTELDWLEREERYRRRVTRLIMISLLLTAAIVGAAFWLQTRRMKATRLASERATAEQIAAAAKQRRDLYAAESTATANRWASFVNQYGVQPIEGVPLLQLPLPGGVSATEYARRAWADYVLAIDPRTTPEQREQWYRQYYIEVMNDGPLRPSAILLPAAVQDSLTMRIERPSFTEIAASQVHVGMREPPAEPAPSLEGLPQAMTPEGGMPPSPPAAEPETAAQPPAAAEAATEPAPTPTPVTEPAETLPDPTPPIEALPEPTPPPVAEPNPIPPAEPVQPPPAPAPPDTTPRP